MHSQAAIRERREDRPDIANDVDAEIAALFALVLITGDAATDAAALDYVYLRACEELIDDGTDPLRSFDAIEAGAAHAAEDIAARHPHLRGYVVGDPDAYSALYFAESVRIGA